MIPRATNPPETVHYDGYHKYTGSVAQTYDESRKVEKHWLKEELFVTQYVRTHKIERLLDLPVGTGRFLQLYDKIPHVTGVDISEDMLAEARKHHQQFCDGRTLRLEQGDVFALAYADKEFDVAIVFRLLHLLPENYLDPAIKELCRVVRKEVALQTYVPMSRRGYWLRKYRSGISRFRSILGIQQEQTQRPVDVATNQPWLHIQAYTHSQKFINERFAANGFSPRHSKLLDLYGHQEVRVTVYSRTR